MRSVEERPETAPKSQAGHVQSVERAATLLEHLLAGDGAMSTLALSRATGLNRTIVHRLLRTMTSLEWVKEVAPGQYDVGPFALLLGHTYMDRTPIRRVALPYLVDLNNHVVRERPWVAALAIAVGDEAVILDRLWQPNAPLDSILDVGTRMPLTGSAHGRCMLATLPPDEGARRVGADDYDRLKERLARIRDQDYLDVAQDEIRPGVSAIACPVRGPDGVAVGSVAISGVRLEPEFDPASELSQHLKRTVQVIAAALPRPWR